jgi:hypothetical protein
MDKTPETPTAALLPRTLVSQGPDTVAAEVEGNVVLLHTTSGYFHQLNEVGSYLWNQVAEPVTIEALCTRSAGDFDADASACRQDIYAFIRELDLHGLVRIDPR